MTKYITLNVRLKAVKADKFYNKKELSKGVKEEMEHTPDRKLAKYIAKHHINKDKKYYSKEKLKRK